MRVVVLAYGRLVWVVPHGLPFRRHAREMLLRFWLVIALTGRGALEIAMLWIGSALV